MMAPTPQDVQALIDSAVSNLQKVTGKYNPAGKYWKPALADLAAARVAAGQLQSRTLTAAFTAKEK